MNKAVTNLIQGARRDRTPGMISAKEERALIYAWQAHGRAAPFKCNDEMLDDKFAATGVVIFGGNGVALNLGQKAKAKGPTVMRVADPAKKTAET